jgi:hypothetical protein
VCGQLAQLIVDQRQKLLGGPSIARLNLGHDSGKLIHWRRAKNERIVLLQRV